MELKDRTTLDSSMTHVLQKPRHGPNPSMSHMASLVNIKTTISLFREEMARLCALMTIRSKWVLTTVLGLNTEKAVIHFSPIT